MSRYIDADKLLEKLKATPRYFDLKFDIEQAETEDVTPTVWGKWILDKEHSIENKIFICSNCNVAVEFQGIRRYNFCPKCGAKMEESE